MGPEEQKALNLTGAALTENINITPTQGIQILLVAVIMGIIIRKLYMRYALTYSSPRGFGNTLLLVLVCVSALIAVVKSSLALSLGLVGALSVVRFRTAVKEPFTLSFILLSVCLGISIGAEQYLFSLLILICGSLITVFLFQKQTGTSSHRKSNIGISADTITLSAAKLDSILMSFKILDEFSNSYSVKTLTTTNQSSDSVIQICLESPEDFESMAARLKNEASVDSISYFKSPA